MSLMLHGQATTMNAFDIVRHLCGAANNFVAEDTILNALRGTGDMRSMLTSLVMTNRLEVYVPLVNNLCGSGCCSNGACGGGCCGCGRYYRVKIG